MFGITKTTISRIKKGVNHQYAIETYNNMNLKERKEIYDNFIKVNNLYEIKINTTFIKNKRKLSKDDVFMILYNNENKIISKAKLSKVLNIKSVNTINCILQGKSYKNFIYEYNKLNINDKNKIALLFSNK